MASGNVSKAEKLLSAMAQSTNCELTPEGKNYLIQRFDPYHDNPIKPTGYPDSFNGHTVSRCVKKTMTLTYKSGGAPDQTTPWDLHIFQTPIMKPTPLTLSITRKANVFTFNPSSTPTKPYGGLMAVASLVSGTDAPFPVQASQFNQLGQLSLSDSDLNDTMRVTAMGFEVIDGTAELYRQGVLTTYRQNQPQRDMSEFIGVSNEADAVANRQSIRRTSQLVRFPPVNSNNALLFPDSKQWKVAQGAYCDIDFNSEEIPMLSPSHVQPICIFDTDSTLMGVDETPIYFPSDGYGVNGRVEPVPGTAGVGFVYNNSCQGQRILPINQTGVILTGLNPLATITVNAIYYLECAPTSDDQELLSLATQSPALDTMCLMLISKLRRDSPVAVKRNENYTGEWFFNGIRDVINKVTPWLANAHYVGSQVSKWIDRAGTNDGLINPQTFVPGNKSVAKKIADEKRPKGKAVPKAPGPAPNKRAFRPKPVRSRALAKNLPYAAQQSAKKSRRNQWYKVEDKIQRRNQKQRGEAGRVRKRK